MSKWDEWKKSVVDVRPWDLLHMDRHVKNHSVSEDRLKICQSCEFYKVTTQCGKCGCFMPLKVKLAEARCPVGKWEKEE